MFIIYHVDTQEVAGADHRGTGFCSPEANNSQVSFCYLKTVDLALSSPSWQVFIICVGCIKNQ